MKNLRLKRIENWTFTVRFCTAAKVLKIKTVGKMKDYCLAHDKIRLPSFPFYSYIGTAKLLKEIEEFEQSYN